SGRRHGGERIRPLRRLPRPAHAPAARPRGEASRRCCFGRAPRGRGLRRASAAPGRAEHPAQRGRADPDRPGEPAQLLHRDTDSWPTLRFGGDPVLVNAIVALSAFTAETGATNLVAGSHLWAPGRHAEPGEVAFASLEPGDALLLRGD